jgi:hypothetical protein
MNGSESMKKIKQRLMVILPLSVLFVILAASSAFASRPPTWPGQLPLL